MEKHYNSFEDCDLQALVCIIFVVVFSFVGGSASVGVELKAMAHGIGSIQNSELALCVCSF